MLNLTMTQDEQEELDFLRWFYDAVDDPLGPACDDVKFYMLRDYKDEHGNVPKGYDLYEEDGDAV